MRERPKVRYSPVLCGASLRKATRDALQSGDTHALLERKNPAACTAGFCFDQTSPPQCARIASSNSATMLVILIIGLTAGPAVSL